MAMKRMKSEETGAKKRIRRSEEQLIRDLEARIAELKTRAARRSAKTSPLVKATLAALHAIDKAVDIAEEQTETAVRHLLADARKPLFEYLQAEGIEVSPTRRPRGRRARASGEAQAELDDRDES
jgi:hypothetical protein